MRNISFHEASIISSLHHPHIVQIYDKGQQDALSFIVLEFTEGTSLYHEMQTQRFFSMKRALTIACMIALALGARIAVAWLNFTAYCLNSLPEVGCGLLIKILLILL